MTAEVAPPQLVVCTAGHIDHGKTAIVRALTGVELDTLPEEQERGITIALGFTALPLGAARLSLVDVPGHEALVRTMIAGAHGVHAAMLVISALEGVMPQTREHLMILDLLKIEQGVVVLSKADLVDEELLALAEADVAELVAGTFLEQAPVIVTSTLTGQGLPELREALAALRPVRLPTDGPFRLPIDRSFVRPGFGTVVSGTARSGVVREGETVKLQPAGQTCRVRGVEVHGEACKQAEAGQRVALNLSGVEQADVPRGTVLCRGAIAVSQMLDLSYHHTAEHELSDGMAVRFLTGTSEQLGRIWLAAEVDGAARGDRCYAQVRLDAPIACWPGDRYVLRRTSPMQTLGGGEILDPWAPKLHRRDVATAHQQLRRLDAGQRQVWLERAGEQGLDPQDWAQRAPGQPAAQLGDRVFADGVLARLEGLLLGALAEFHTTHPLALGAQRRELRRDRLAHLPDKVFDALLHRLAARGTAEVDGPLVRATAFKVAPSASQLQLQQRVLASLTDAGLAGLTHEALAALHDDPAVEALTRLLIASGSAQQLLGIGVVATSQLDRLDRALHQHFLHQEQLSPTELKDLTGLSRKSAIPLLEWLDRTGRTRRVGDVRVRGASLPAV